MLNKLMKNKKGFTLIELIVVIAILGILAAVLVPSIGNYVTKANDSAAAGDAKAAQQAAQRLATDIDYGNVTCADVAAFKTTLASSAYGITATVAADQAAPTAASADGVYMKVTLTGGSFTIVSVWAKKGKSIKQA